MSIQSEFRTLGLAVVIATVATAAMVILTLDAMDEVVTISDRRYDSYLLADELRASSEGLTRNVRTYAITGDSRYEQNYWEILDIRNGVKPRPADAAIAPGQKVPLLTLMKQRGITKAELDKVAEASKKSDGLVALETEAMHLVKGIYKDAGGNYTVKGEPNKARAAELLFGSEYHGYVREIMHPFSAFFRLLESRTRKEVSDVSNTASTYVIGSMICLCIVFVLIVITIFYVRKRVSIPLGISCNLAEKVAGGELDHRFRHRHNDEIGALSASLNKMVENLKERIEEANLESSKARDASDLAEHAQKQAEIARGAAESAKRDGMFQAAGQLEQITTEVSSASEVLSAQIAQSSKGMLVQQQQSSETATAMGEMNTSVLEVAHSASIAAEDADKAKMTALEGGKIVSQVVESINRVDIETRRMKDGLDELGNQAESIGQVINVITDIADQTNLLALNAAIEAARAGEAGRGFAVVADEVRKLAEKTMLATTEVSEAVGAIQKSSERNIKNMNSAADAVEQSTELAGYAGSSLAEIVEIIEGTASQVRTIATASEQQSAVSKEINRSTDEVNRIASETSEAMEQSVRAVDELAALSGKLQSVIGELKRI